MTKFKDDLRAFTDEEALNQEIPQNKWEVIKKVWAINADLSATPSVMGFRSGDVDDSTVHLDVTDCSVLNFYTWATWFGVFSESPIIIGIGSGNTFNTANMIKLPWRYSDFVVPKGAKYFNYRVTDYGSVSADKHYTIIALKQ